MSISRVQEMADLIYNQWKQVPDENQAKWREVCAAVLCRQPEFQSLDASRIVGLKSQIKSLEEAVDVLTSESQPQWTLCPEMPVLGQPIYMVLHGTHEVCMGTTAKRVHGTVWIKIDEGECDHLEMSLSSVIAWTPRTLPIYKPPEDKFVQRVRELATERFGDQAVGVVCIVKQAQKELANA